METPGGGDFKVKAAKQKKPEFPHPHPPPTTPQQTTPECCQEPGEHGWCEPAWQFGHLVSFCWRLWWGLWAPLTLRAPGGFSRDLCQSSCLSSAVTTGRYHRFPEAVSAPHPSRPGCLDFSTADMWGHNSLSWGPPCTH